MFSKIIASVLFFMFVGATIHSMNQNQEQTVGAQRHHHRSYSTSDIDRYNFDEPLELIVCSCPPTDQKEEKQLSVFEQDKKFTSPLFDSAKNLISAANENIEEAQVQELYQTFKKMLINQRRCIPCLTITLHFVIREFFDEKCTVHLAKKLILHGGKVNSYVLRGSWFDNYTPLNWAKRKNFDTLEQLLLEEGAKTANPSQLIIIDDAHC